MLAVINLKQNLVILSLN